MIPDPVQTLPRYAPNDAPRFFPKLQGQTGAGVYFPGVYPLEHFENSFKIFGRDADAIVLLKHPPLVIKTFGADMYFGGAVSLKFQSIAERGLEERRFLRRLTLLFNNNLLTFMDNMIKIILYFAFCATGR